MPRKKAAPAEARVWIELDPPSSKEQGDERAAMATNMLRRLGVERSRFWWSTREARYCYGDEMGYVSLSDNGHWLNLEFLGRPLQPAERPQAKEAA